MSRILSIFLFISYNFEEWMEDFIFRSTFKWLILSYSFKELNNLLFQATKTKSDIFRNNYIFSIVIDYYYSFSSMYEFLNQLMSSKKNILIYFFVYHIIITAHPFWPVILGPIYTNEYPFYKKRINIFDRQNSAFRNLGFIEQIYWNQYSKPFANNLLL